MRPFRQISLFLSSLLGFLLFSCSPASGYKLVRSATITEKEVEPVINKTTPLLYKAKIDLFNRHFSGLILLKHIDDQVSHLTFVTEIGMKMFDFEIRDTSFKLVYIFKPLDSPKIIRLLESDMKLILLHDLLNKEAAIFEKKEKRIYKVQSDFRYYYVTAKNAKTIKRSVKKGKVFTKVKVNYNYTTRENADRIRLKHKGLIRLKIQLNTLNKPQS